MSAIRADELKEFRERLGAMHRRLLGAVGGLGDEALSPSAPVGSGQTAEAAGDTGDLSVHHRERDVAISLLETERHLLGQVAAALGRLDRGTFGRCTACGRAIPAERLRAVPYTQHCIRCASRLEKESGGSPAPVGTT
jgi:RNA polymerase-binding protein DksA